jgi:hypothetical protein
MCGRDLGDAVVEDSEQVPRCCERGRLCELASQLADGASLQPALRRLDWLRRLLGGRVCVVDGVDDAAVVA